MAVTRPETLGEPPKASASRGMVGSGPIGVQADEASGCIASSKASMACLLRSARTDARRDVLEWVSSQLVIPLFALPDHFGRFSDAGLGLLCRGEPDQQCSLKKNEEGEGAADRHASPEGVWVGS